MDIANMMQTSFDENNSFGGNKAEHRKLLEIQLSLMSSDITSTIDPFVLELAATEGRVFIKDAVLEKACRRVNKPYRFWLFNDCFAYGTAVGGGRYQFVKKVDLATCSISDFPSIFYENAMVISDAGKSFVAFSNSRNTQQEWIYSVSKAIVKLRCSPTSMARFHSQKKSTLPGDTPVSTRRNEWGIDVYEEKPPSNYAVHVNDTAISPPICTAATKCVLCAQVTPSSLSDHSHHIKLTHVNLTKSLLEMKIFSADIWIVQATFRVL